MDSPDDGKHLVRRVRRETRRRTVEVAKIVDLTAKMRRIVFASDELGDFESEGADDHVKLFFATGIDGQSEVMRDFTPRAFDRSNKTLTIDFVLHDHGPASDWARHAEVGSSLSIGGPRGSMIVTDDFDWYLLVGDETALPAIGRRLEELRAEAIVHCVILADNDVSVIDLHSAAALSLDWKFRAGRTASDEDLLLEGVSDWQPPSGEGFVFVAAEAAAAQGVKAKLLARGQNPNWMKSSGYWSRSADGEGSEHQ